MLIHLKCGGYQGLNNILSARGLVQSAACGHRPVVSRDWRMFGCGQAIVIDDGVLLGGADSRMDGYAAGL